MLESSNSKLYDVYQTVHGTRRRSTTSRSTRRWQTQLNKCTVKYVYEGEWERKCVCMCVRKREKERKKEGRERKRRERERSELVEGNRVRRAVVLCRRELWKRHRCEQRALEPGEPVLDAARREPRLALRVPTLLNGRDQRAEHVAQVQIRLRLRLRLRSTNWVYSSRGLYTRRLCRSCRSGDRRSAWDRDGLVTRRAERQVVHVFDRDAAVFWVLGRRRNQWRLSAFRRVRLGDRRRLRRGSGGRTRRRSGSASPVCGGWSDGRIGTSASRRVRHASDARPPLVADVRPLALRDNIFDECLHWRRLAYSAVQLPLIRKSVGLCRTCERAHNKRVKQRFWESSHIAFPQLYHYGQCNRMIFRVS